MSHPRVVNVRAKGATWDVYVGRGRCPCKQRFCPHGPTGFGNPFTVGRDGDLALVKYLNHLVARMREAPAFAQAVCALKGRRLGCWCAPGLCHGDVLARVADGEQPTRIRADLFRAFGLEEVSA